MNVFAIQFSSQPEDQNILNGGATFEATAVDTFGDITYQWQENDATFGWTDITGETNSTLSLTGLTGGDVGNEYRVVASSVIGGASGTSETATLLAEVTTTTSTTPAPTTSTTPCPTCSMSIDIENNMDNVYLTTSSNANAMEFRKNDALGNLLVYLMASSCVSGTATKTIYWYTENNTAFYSNLPSAVYVSGATLTFNTYQDTATTGRIVISWVYTGCSGSSSSSYRIDNNPVAATTTTTTTSTPTTTTTTTAVPTTTTTLPPTSEVASYDIGSTSYADSLSISDDSSYTNEGYAAWGDAEYSQGGLSNAGIAAVLEVGQTTPNLLAVGTSSGEQRGKRTSLSNNGRYLAITSKSLETEIGGSGVQYLATRVTVYERVSSSWNNVADYWLDNVMYLSGLNSTQLHLELNALQIDDNGNMLWATTNGYVVFATPAGISGNNLQYIQTDALIAALSGNNSSSFVAYKSDTDAVSVYNFGINEQTGQTITGNGAIKKIDISADGQTVAVLGSDRLAIYQYDIGSSSWQLVDSIPNPILSSADYIQNISLGSNGSVIAMHYPNKPEGSTVEIKYTSNLTNLVAPLTGSTNYFGHLIDLTNVDNRIAIASQGKIQVFGW